MIWQSVFSCSSLLSVYLFRFQLHLLFVFAATMIMVNHFTIFIILPNKQHLDIDAREQKKLEVASLGLVSPGAATDGCHPIFSWKKSYHHFYSLPLKVITFFSCRLLATPIFPRRLSSVLSKFGHKKNNFRLGVNPLPLEGVARGGPPPSPLPRIVTPLWTRSDYPCFSFLIRVPQEVCACKSISLNV